jgi:hypothetical protein
MRPWTAGALFAAFAHLGAGQAAACGPAIEVRFIDAADGDVFTVRNVSEQPWSLVSLVIRLAGSRGRLVFDTAGGGPGYSMHQPFAAVNGEVGLLDAPDVGDGADEVTLRFSRFTPGRDFLFVIDVDDRLEFSDFGRAVVSGAEIEGAGAEAVLTMEGGVRSVAHGRFGDGGRAVLRGGLCA